MFLRELTLKKFRNYDLLNIEFSPGINFIIGENGIGKTNILEAISITSNIKSFRNTPDQEIIKWGETSYYCSSIVENDKKIKFEVGCSNISNKLKKKIKIDNENIKKAADYYGKFLSVIFSPSDINIINGSPDLRRKYFDAVISKVNSDYFVKLNDFKKILFSRNKLLKLLKNNKSKNYAQLDIWDQMFADKAFYIIKERVGFLENFCKFFKKSYKNISKDEDAPDIIYDPSTKLVDYNNIIKILKEKRTRDIIIGSTGIGPQRDDYKLCSEDRLFVNYASQGQKRTAAISLKITECDFIEEKKSEKCLILVDDIFSELDRKRQKNLIKIIRKSNQVIFTMVNSSLLSSNDFGNYSIFRIEEGEIVKDTS